MTTQSRFNGKAYLPLVYHDNEAFNTPSEKVGPYYTAKITASLHCGTRVVSLVYTDIDPFLMGTVSLFSLGTLVTWLTFTSDICSDSGNLIDYTCTVCHLYTLNLLLVLSHILSLPPLPLGGW